MGRIVGAPDAAANDSIYIESSSAAWPASILSRDANHQVVAVVRFVFSVEDLALTRFAISPMWELVHSLLALRDPSHAALHVPWLRSLSGRLHGLPLERAAALTPPRGYSPDFLLPLPSGPLGDIADDLAALRATPIARIRADMTLFATQHKRGPQIAEPYLTNPRREVGASPICSRPTGPARSSPCGRGFALSSTPTSPIARGA